MGAHERETGSFVVVSLDQARHCITQIQSVLESVGIAAEVVESGRRLRWNTAVVLRIPEQRLAEAMLALGMNGFADVVAYQSGEGEADDGAGQMTRQYTRRTKEC